MRRLILRSCFFAFTAFAASLTSALARAQDSPSALSLPSRDDCPSLPVVIFRADTAAPDSLRFETPPAIIPGTYRPSYPPDLAQAGVSGEVNLQYVIDDQGLVIPCSITLLDPTDMAFVDSGKQALLRARFRPAGRAGRPVPAVVKQRLLWTRH
jgi:hypothetical protein